MKRIFIVASACLCAVGMNCGLLMYRTGEMSSRIERLEAESMATLHRSIESMAHMPTEHPTFFNVDPNDFPELLIERAAVVCRGAVAKPHLVEVLNKSENLLLLYNCSKCLRKIGGLTAEEKRVVKMCLDRINSLQVPSVYHRKRFQLIAELMLHNEDAK